MVHISPWFMMMMSIYWEKRTYYKTCRNLVVALKENGLEVNIVKTKYMVMPREQDVGRSHGIKTDNSSFERLSSYIWEQS
jgi:hypothetical protein